MTDSEERAKAGRRRAADARMARSKAARAARAQTKEAAQIVREEMQGPGEAAVTLYIGKMILRIELRTQ